MPRPTFPKSAAGFAAGLALAFAGCEKPSIRVYTVEKDKPAPTPAPTAKADAERPERPRPQVSYTLPAGWKEAGPNSLSVANFTATTEAGSATVNITPLAGMQGREGVIVNMWRSQVGLPALNDEDVAKEFTAVEIAGGKGQLFEVSGSNNGQPIRIVTAFAHVGGDSWFYKLQGTDAAVAALKPSFVDFLKTVQIKEGAASAEVTAKPAPAAESPRPEPGWTVPAAWQKAAVGQMQLAKFTVPAVEKAQAEVTVSVFPSDTGGTLANVNRWRRQLGLGDIDEAGLKDCVKPLEGATGAQLVELVNGEKQMLAAIVPRDNTWWFYKLAGDGAAVNAARADFVRFALSAP